VTSLLRPTRKKKASGTPFVLEKKTPVRSVHVYSHHIDSRLTPPRQSIKRNHQGPSRLGYVYHDFDSQLSDPLSVSIERKIGDLEQTVQGLQCTLHVYEQKHECESLFACGRVYDAAQHLLEIINTMSEDLQHNQLIKNWLEGECLRHFIP
jgi:hypothetical protein